MEEIDYTSIQEPHQWNTGNSQEIREKLMRMAVRYCSFYATDVLILFNTIEKKIQEGDFSINIGFRQSGVDWPLDERGKYRYLATIKKEGSRVTLLGENGNC